MKIDPRNVNCVIMAGGIGSRFWPMSRQNKPKQFLDILGVGQTLLQQTYTRFNKLVAPENIYIVTHNDYLDLVKQQLPNLPVANIICEPARRNTAPCIGYAAFKIQALNPNAIMVVSPSDHLILNEDIYLENIKRGVNAAAQNGKLITVGIKPTRPDTGYGYIQLNNEELPEGIKKVKLFTEKPNTELAQEFVNSGEFIWNTGINIWAVNNIMQAFEEFLPDIFELFKGGEGLYNTNKEWDFIRNAYLLCKSISIDYGILEKAKNVYALEAGFGWSDLGTWGSVYDLADKDPNQNAIIGKNALFYDSTNNVVRTSNGKLVVLQGLENYIVVDTESVLLICKKSEEQNIREIVNQVKIEKGEEFV